MNANQQNIASYNTYNNVISWHITWWHHSHITCIYILCIYIYIYIRIFNIHESSHNPPQNRTQGPPNPLIGGVPALYRHYKSELCPPHPGHICRVNHGSWSAEIWKKPGWEKGWWDLPPNWKILKQFNVWNHHLVEYPLFRIPGKSPTGPTERTPKPECLVTLATYLGVPFNFWWKDLIR